MKGGKNRQSYKIKGKTNIVLMRSVGSHRHANGSHIAAPREQVGDFSVVLFQSNSHSLSWACNVR